MSVVFELESVEKLDITIHFIDGDTAQTTYSRQEFVDLLQAAVEKEIDKLLKYEVSAARRGVSTYGGSI